MRALAIWCVLGLALAASAAGQEAKMERIRAAFPPGDVERIEALVAEYRSAGVPTDPILDKALEGAAKRVPADRILAAVSEYAVRLGQATELVGASEPGAVVAGADALRRGVAPEAVREVGSRAGERRPVALVVLGDLVEAGVPVDRALEVVREALAAGRRPTDLTDIPDALRRLIRDGARPADAATDLHRYMRRGVPPRDVRLRRPPGDVVRTPGGLPVPPDSDPPPDRVRRRPSGTDLSARAGSDRPE